VVTRPCHLWGGRHSGTTAATATTDVADVADVFNAAPTPVLIEEKCGSSFRRRPLRSSTHTQLEVWLHCRRRQQPPRGVSRNDGAAPISFCPADVLLAGRRATSLPSTSRVLSVFAATFPSVVAVRAGGVTGSWGRRVSRAGGWHRQCVWDGDGGRVGAHSLILAAFLASSLALYDAAAVVVCLFVGLHLSFHCIRCLPYSLPPLWRDAAVCCCSQSVGVVFVFPMLDRCRTGR